LGFLQPRDPSKSLYTWPGHQDILGSGNELLLGKADTGHNSLEEETRGTKSILGRRAKTQGQKKHRVNPRNTPEKKTSLGALGKQTKPGCDLTVRPGGGRNANTKQ